MAVNRRGLKLACFFCKKICPCFSRYLFIITLEGLKRPPWEALGKLLPDGWFAPRWQTTYLRKVSCYVG